MTSVGYGDVLPLNDEERVYVIILECTGGFVYALLIANLSSMIGTMDANTKETKSQLAAVRSYVQNRGFPKELSTRMRRYFKHLYSTKSAVDEQGIINQLSSSLRVEVATFLVSTLMNSVDLFVHLGPSMWAKILPILRPVRTVYTVVKVVAFNIGSNLQ